MFDDLTGLFHENVLPAFEAYVRARTANISGRNTLLHHAVEASSALYHFREHVPAEWQQTRKRVTEECPGYRLIADVCNAAKHQSVSRPTSEGTPLVLRASDLSEEIVVTRYTDAEGEYFDATVRVIAKCGDDATRDLDTALVAVLNYWIRLLRANLEVQLPERIAAQEAGSKLVNRAEARTVNFEVLNSVRWKTAMRLQRFDSVNGCSEPIDLKDSDIQFRVYEPPKYSVQISVTLANDQEPISTTLVFSPAQSGAFHLLKTDKERDEFTRQIVLERHDEVQSALQSASEEPPGPTSDS
jgi:hypothetical protein